MKLAIVKASCKNLSNTKREKTDIVNVDNVNPDFWKDQPLFCEYQIKWLIDKSPVSVIEKSRQIGYSYTIAFRAVYKAIKGERDTIINSYNLMAAKEVIKDCIRWANILNMVFQIIVEKDVVNECNIFEIKFLNGYSVYAISGDPVNFRGKSGSDIVIDEAAYRKISLKEILAAAMATLIHGGTIRIGSTHAGVDSDFNKLVQEVLENKLPYSHHKTTFRQAVEQGLYKRICEKLKKDESDQVQWVEFIYSQYGERALEELDVIASDFSEEGKLFTTFKRTELIGNPWELLYFRYHDLASTEDDKNDSDTAFYSASIKVAYNIELLTYTIVDWKADKVSPLAGDQIIEDCAIEDGFQAIQLIENEPGSSGEKYVSIMQDRLAKLGYYQVYGYRPLMKKIKRLIPCANAAARGQLMMLDSPMMDELESLLRRISKVPKPLISDLGDCLSGIYDYVENDYNAMLGS